MVQNNLARMTCEWFKSTKGNQVSRTKILRLLQPNTWLCDQIINICLERLVSEEYHINDTFFFTELTSSNARLSVPKWDKILVSCKPWAIPVHLDSHWSLIVLKNLNQAIFVQYWDSMPNQSRCQKIESKLLQSYNLFSNVQKQFFFSHNENCYIQTDTSSCGLFLIGNMMSLIARKIPCNINPDEARIAIALLICESIEPFNDDWPHP